MSALINALAEAGTRADLLAQVERLIAEREETALRHDARVTELLAANNAEVDRRRVAEAALDAASFQARVAPWLIACHGVEIADDLTERGDRFAEEALELLQAVGFPRERLHALTAYVWGRPPGVPAQEVGGVMVTLAAFCRAHGLNMHAAGEKEVVRIWTKIEQIRAKQRAKPTGAALLQAPATSSDAHHLLTCPFCGSAAGFIRDRDEDGEFVAVACTGCGCGSGKHYPLMDDARPNAANEWNRRAALVGEKGGVVHLRLTQEDVADAISAYPAEPNALQSSLDQLTTWLSGSDTLDEIEDQTSFGESIMLVVHELKRLRSVRAAPAPEGKDREPLVFTYRNWRGETATRRVIPREVYFGVTEWHPEPQWLLRALDLDKGEERDFAMKDIGAALEGKEQTAAFYVSAAQLNNLRILPFNYLPFRLTPEGLFQVPLYAAPPDADCRAAAAMRERCAEEADLYNAPIVGDAIRDLPLPNEES